MLKLGARVHVIAHRSTLLEALQVMAQRQGATLERMKGAHALWMRERARRTVHRRNVAIWKAKVAGRASRDLADEHGLSPRMVDLIAAKIERELIGSSAAPSPAAARARARSEPR